MKRKNQKQNFSLVLNWLLTAIKFKIIKQRKYYEAAELLQLFTNATNKEQSKMGFTKSLNKCASMKVECQAQKVKFYKIEVTTRKFEYIILNDNDFEKLDIIRINPRRSNTPGYNTIHPNPPIVSPCKERPTQLPTDMPTQLPTDIPTSELTNITTQITEEAEATVNTN